MYKKRPSSKSQRRIFLKLYLVVVTLAGAIDAFAFALVPKPDTSVLSFLAFLDGTLAILYQLQERNAGYFQIPDNDHTETTVIVWQTQCLSMVPIPAPTTTAENPSFETQQHKPTRAPFHWQHTFVLLERLNVALMAIHATWVIFSTIGATELAMIHRYPNPYVFCFTQKKGR